MTLKHTSILDFFQEVADEDAAEKWLSNLRWPGEVCCVACGSSSIGRVKRRRLFQCRRCRKRFSVTSGTAMHGTKLPLRTWAAAIFIFTTSSKGVSARKITRWIGVSYQTAWFLLHRIRSMMLSGPPLSGVVEIDETYVGTRRRKPGRGAGPGLVLTAVERGGRAFATAITSHSKAAIQEALRERLDAQATAITDGLPAYHWLGERRQIVIHSAGQFAVGNAHVNTAEAFHSLFKRAITGVYHWISTMHASRYAAEAAARWNDELSLGQPLTYRRLVA